jgi:protein-S-isoprenylcysteine O-methyltransferase Ste14
MTNLEGLRAMLEHLGIMRRRLIAGVAIITIFEVTIIGLATAQAWVEYELSWSPVMVSSVFWVIWTLWHSWMFPRNRLRYLTSSRYPYRRAFVLDIYPWVSAGFSQMWRPLINGDTWSRVFSGRLALHSTAITLGVLVSTASLVIIIQAIRSIGIHNAAFMGEFVDSESFVLQRTGIYRFVTHPLFWSGIAHSCGLAIAVATTVAYQLACVNILYGFAYHWLEDRRLRRVFGAKYEYYRRRERDSILEAVRHSFKAREARTGSR